MEDHDVVAMGRGDYTAAADEMGALVSLFLVVVLDGCLWLGCCACARGCGGVVVSALGCGTCDCGGGTIVVYSSSC